MNGRRTLLLTAPTYRLASQEKEFTNIESVAKHYEQIMDRLKKLVTDGKSKSYHSVDAARFYKLVEWVAFKEYNLKMVEEAWSSPHFWPFLETMEATKLVQNDPSQLVIRLSNTHSGTITITRFGTTTHGVGERRRFYAHVKHKRCVVNPDGMLMLISEGNNQKVSWQELVNYVLTRECCICLEEILPTDGVTLPCKHCFHKTCLQGYLSYANRHGKEDRCVSCRVPFREMEWPETLDPKSLNTTPIAISRQSSNTPITEDMDEQHPKSEQSSVPQSDVQFRSGDNNQAALYSAPKCCVPSATTLQGFENNCNQSQSLRSTPLLSQSSLFATTPVQKHEPITLDSNTENKKSYPRNDNYKKSTTNHKTPVAVVGDTTCDKPEKKNLFKRLGLQHHK